MTKGGRESAAAVVVVATNNSTRAGDTESTTFSFTAILGIIPTHYVLIRDKREPCKITFRLEDHVIRDTHIMKPQ